MSDPLSPTEANLTNLYEATPTKLCADYRTDNGPPPAEICYQYATWRRTVVWAGVSDPNVGFVAYEKVE